MPTERGLSDASNRQARLPFLPFHSGVDHVEGLVYLKHLWRQEPVAIPGIGIGRGRKDRVRRIGFERTEIKSPNLTCPPGLAVVTAVEDVEELRPSEDLRLAHPAAVPPLPRASEDWIG